MSLATRNIDSYETYVADELHADLGDWTPAPQLLPVRLKRVALPGIDYASFVYRVGTMVQHHYGSTPGPAAPLSTLARAYIRIRIISHNPGPTVAHDWIGIIDRKSVSEIPGTDCGGDQVFTAFGLAHELLKHTITDSVVIEDFTSTDDTDSYTIHRGIAFNRDDLSQGSDRHGNRHYNAGFSVSKIFARAPDRNQSDPTDGICAAQWSGSEAMEYTLANDTPSEIQCRLRGQTTCLNARILPQVDRDRRTVLDVIVDIVGRNNGVIAYIDFQQPTEDDDEDRLLICVVIKSAAVADILIGSYTFPGNDAQIALDVRTTRDLESIEISESGFEAYDQVIYEGNWITTTATYSLVDDCTPDWDTADETAFQAADPTPSQTDLLKRAEAADQFRQQERYDTIYRQFGVTDKSLTPKFGNGTTYSLAPNPAATLNTAADIATMWADGFTDFDIWRRPFLAEIPNPDLDNPAAFCLFPVTDGLAIGTTPTWATEKWTRGEKLNLTGGGIGGRRFSVTVTPTRVGGSDYIGHGCHTGPGVLLNVLGGPQWLIATLDFETAPQVSPQNDPRNKDVLGLEYSQAVFTATLECDQRVEQKVPDGPAAAIGNTPPRIKRITAPQFRLDVALPGTVTGVDGEAKAVLVFHLGEIWRDDRTALWQLAAADYQFSGPSHRTVNFTYLQLNPFSLQIGSMITTVQHPCGTDTCNTVVTNLEFNFEQLSVQCETAFEELDVLRTFGGRAGTAPPPPPANAGEFQWVQDLFQ